MRDPRTAFRSALSIAMPVATLLAILAIWHLTIVLFDVPEYKAPTPGAVARAFVSHAGDLVSATIVTGTSAAIGFATSLILGTGLGFLFAQSSWARASLMPYALFLQTVPVVAIAPIVIGLFGYGLRSVALVSLMISLFPMIASGTAGFLAVDPDHADLFRLHRANWFARLFKLRVPSAIPHLVTGAKTSAGLAVIGAIVGELFAGAAYRSRGLALSIETASERLQSDRLFAAVIASTLLGLVFYLLVVVAERTVLRRWTRRKRDGSNGA